MRANQAKQGKNKRLNTMRSAQEFKILARLTFMYIH